MTAPTQTDPGDDAGAAAHRPSVPLQPLSLVRAAHLGRSAPVLASTPLGTVDAGAIADVDGAGLVAMRGATWSLDWWVGAEDRWHHPSREAAVRQAPVGEAPVVETAMRVPGGDVVHRCYGVRASSPGVADGAGWDDSGVVVEVENLTAVPVAVAFAVRPTTLAGDGSLGAVESDGPVVRVDGRVALVLSRPPARSAHGRPGEPADLLVDGRDDEATVSLVASRDGLEVAFVVPVPHTATVRVLLPRVAEPPKRRLLRSDPPAPEPAAGWSAPEADSIVSGWEAHTRSATRLEVPEPLFAQVLAASQRSLVLAAADGFLGEELEPGGTSAAERAAWVCEALSRTGLTEPLGPLARALVASQRLSGAVKLDDGSDATVALVHAAGTLLATGAPGWTDDLLGPAAKAVHRLAKGEGLLDPSSVAITAEALSRLAPALRSIGQPDVADHAQQVAHDLTAAAPPATAPAGDGLAGRGGTAAAIASIRTRLRSGDAGAVIDLLSVARLGGPGTMVDRVDDAGVPCGSNGFDPAAVAVRVDALVDLVVVDAPEGPALLPAWPSSWWGQPVEAHAIRTRWGLASFGLRWHGERPAILWEVERGDGVDEQGPVPVLTAPALDPSWRGEGWSGEALLGPVEVPATLVAIRGAATDPQPRPTTGAPVVGQPPDEGQSFS